MCYRRFDSDDYEKFKGQYLYGRIKEYIHNRGYGYVYTDMGKEVFLSSYDLGKKIESDICVGTTIKFNVEPYENKYVARNIEIVDNSLAKESIILPNGERLPIRRIAKFGYVSGKTNLENTNISEEDLISHGYTVDMLESLFVLTSYGEEFNFFSEESPIKGDGQVKNIKELYRSFEERLLFL